MNKYYYHAIRGGVAAIPVLYDIFLSGEIKPKRQLGWRIETGFNGLDYVSVCRNEQEKKKECSFFQMFVQNHFCLIISDQVEAIKTVYIENYNPMFYHQMLKQLRQIESPRYSSFLDEYQVKGTIPISSVVGIGIPISFIEEAFYSIHDRENWQQLKAIIQFAQQLSIDIIDSSNLKAMEEYEKQKTTLVSQVEKKIQKLELENE